MAGNTRAEPRPVRVCAKLRAATPTDPQTGAAAAPLSSAPGQRETTRRARPCTNSMQPPVDQWDALRCCREYVCTSSTNSVTCSGVVNWLIP